MIDLFFFFLFRPRRAATTRYNTFAIVPKKTSCHDAVVSDVGLRINVLVVLPLEYNTMQLCQTLVFVSTCLWSSFRVQYDAVVSDVDLRKNLPERPYLT